MSINILITTGRDLKAKHISKREKQNKNKQKTCLFFPSQIVYNLGREAQPIEEAASNLNSALKAEIA